MCAHSTIGRARTCRHAVMHALNLVEPGLAAGTGASSGSLPAFAARAPFHLPADVAPPLACVLHASSIRGARAHAFLAASRPPVPRALPACLRAQPSPKPPPRTHTHRKRELPPRPRALSTHGVPHRASPRSMMIAVAAAGHRNGPRMQRPRCRGGEPQGRPQQQPPAVSPRHGGRACSSCEFVPPLRDQSKAQQLQLGREAPASCGLCRAGWAGATRW